MNFSDDNGPCDCAACSGPADLAFGALVMEKIHELGPMPIGAVGMLGMISGSNPLGMAGAMSFIQSSGLIDTVDSTGNPCDPDAPTAVSVILTKSGTCEVERCIALDKLVDEKNAANADDTPRPRFDPNNN